MTIDRALELADREGTQLARVLAEEVRRLRDALDVSRRDYDALDQTAVEMIHRKQILQMLLAQGQSGGVRRS